MSGDLGNISTGLGNFTPEVWKRLGDTIIEAEGERASNLSSDTPRRELPVQFLAKIVKAELINTGNTSTCDPVRQFRYWFEQVGVRFTINNGVTIVDMPGGIKTSATNGLYAFNGAEIGVPFDRGQSVGGIMLEKNGYPDLTVAPTIHGADTNNGGQTNTISLGNGPIVNISLIDCHQTGGTSLPMVGFFYSAIPLDGKCTADCDG